MVEHGKLIDLREDFSRLPFLVPGQDQFPVFWCNQVCDCPPREFSAVIAGQCGKRRVMEDEQAILGNEDAIMALFNDRAVLCLALAQCFLHNPAFTDIPAKGKNPHSTTVW